MRNLCVREREGQKVSPRSTFEDSRLKLIESQSEQAQDTVQKALTQLTIQW